MLLSSSVQRSSTVVAAIFMPECATVGHLGVWFSSRGSHYATQNAQARFARNAEGRRKPHHPFGTASHLTGHEKRDYLGQANASRGRPLSRRLGAPPPSRAGHCRFLRPSALAARAALRILRCVVRLAHQTRSQSVCSTRSDFPFARSRSSDQRRTPSGCTSIPVLTSTARPCSAASARTASC